MRRVSGALLLQGTGRESKTPGALILPTSLIPFVSLLASVARKRRSLCIVREPRLTDKPVKGKLLIEPWPCEWLRRPADEAGEREIDVMAEAVEAPVRSKNPVISSTSLSTSSRPP